MIGAAFSVFFTFQCSTHKASYVESAQYFKKVDEPWKAHVFRWKSTIMHSLCQQDAPDCRKQSV